MIGQIVLTPTCSAHRHWPFWAISYNGQLCEVKPERGLAMFGVEAFDVSTSTAHSSYLRQSPAPAPQLRLRPSITNPRTSLKALTPWRGVAGRPAEAVDTYGGAERLGGNSLSGKDRTKMGRSAAYTAPRGQKRGPVPSVRLSYAIGVAHLVAVTIETFGTEKTNRHVITQVVDDVINLRPEAIIRHIRSPIYEKIAVYGHFGREEADFSWEGRDKVEELRNAAKCVPPELYGW